ncbi:MAG TPA: flagellar basal body P-ring protein FlgI [Planctomycetota bacterium]|nr:flagellar basal body P-ring protein FlgI [Planctomycetota bacterium]
MKTATILLAVLAGAAPAWGQSVRDYVEVQGARANKLIGYGLVTGLNGQGDSPAGESARLLKNLLQNLVSPDAVVQKVESRGVALVLVTAELPAFQKKGTRIDVLVSTLGDAKSLAGGELQLTELRGPSGRRDPHVYGLASGRLVVSGDARRGNPTVASVPGGAIVERELEHPYVVEADGRSYIQLVLRRPDPALASQLAAQINAGALRTPEGRRIEVATALDGGSIRVRVPSAQELQAAAGAPPDVDYAREPVRWLDRILGLPVVLSGMEPPAVVLHDASRTVAWTGEVRLRAGSVLMPPASAGARPAVFHARDAQLLSEFLEKVAPAVGEHQLVDLVRALHDAGLVAGEVRSR